MFYADWHGPNSQATSDLYAKRPVFASLPILLPVGRLLLRLAAALS
jgi:hypothetical protein